MPRSLRSILALFGIAMAVTVVRAQTDLPGDRPKVLPPDPPAAKADLDHHEAVKLYGLAVLQERQQRLVEATRSLERAVRLDPEAAHLWRALFPLYLALDRGEDALAACKKALELEPGDFETWYRYARQLRLHNQPQEAIAALKRAAACAGLKERPDLHAQISFDLGVLHESAGDLAAAETAFRDVAAVLDNPDALLEQGPFNREEIDAQAAETWERLGRVCVKAGRFPQAIEAFRKAQKRDPSRAARLAYNLADVYRARGNKDEALQCLDHYLQTQPTSVEAYRQKIELLDSLRRGGEVLPALRQYAERDKHNLNLRLLLAEEAARRGRPEEAEGIYRQLLVESPRVEVYRGLFGLYRRQTDGGSRMLDALDGAFREAAKAVENKDEARASSARIKGQAILQALRDDAAAVGVLLPAVAERLRAPRGRREPALTYQTEFYVGVLAARAGKLEEAEKVLRNCLDNLPPNSRLNESQVYSALLEVLRRGRKHAAVVEVCRQGLRTAQFTSRVLFHTELASALIAQGKADEAVAEANNAVDVSTEESRFFCRRHRASILSEAGRFEQAVAECQSLLKDFPDPGKARDVRYVLSSIYSAAKENTKAEEQLELILKEDPADAGACNDLGYLLAERNKDLERAEELIRRALELDRNSRQGGKGGVDGDRDNAAYIDSLGWVLFRRGRLDEARKELERATALADGKEDPVVWDHLGDVRFRQKDLAGAGDAWRNAVRLYEAGRRRTTDPRYQEIKQKLQLPELQNR